MEELVQKVVEKTGISEEQARGAIETVAGFLKEKLPESVSGYVDQALGLASGAVDKIDVGSVASALGGLFGKK
jgi:hypothetical protein